MSAMSTIPFLPWDIILDILSRLPVPRLLRLRTVSKSWRTLIDSNEFTYKHLLHSFNSYTFNLLLKSSTLYALPHNTLEDQIISSYVYELQHPFQGSTFLSHCNGLFLFRKSKSELLLWNPSTRKHQNIQCPEMEFTFENKVTYKNQPIYGFGYDSVTDDYKVVIVVKFTHYPDLFITHVEVYSSKSNSWRRVQDFPCYPLFPYGIFVGGGLHWIGTAKRPYDGTKLITAFDLETEEYYIVPQPKYEKGGYYISIDVLGGCLCLVGHDCFREPVSISVMKEYGVESSWTKLLSFSASVLTTFIHLPPDTDDFEPPSEVLEYVKPIAYSKCGKKVLLQQNWDALFWYDLEKESLAYVEINWSEMWNFTSAFFCVDSLVQLNDTLT